MLRPRLLALLALCLALTTSAHAEPETEGAEREPREPAAEAPVDFGTIESEDARDAQTPGTQASSQRPPARPVEAPPPKPVARPARTAKGIYIGMHLSLRLVLGDYGDGRPATVISGPGMRARTDFGYAFDPHLVLGGYFKGAYGERGSALKPVCSEDDDLFCLSSLFGLGAALHYLPLPDATLSPWLRYSAGISIVYTGSDPFAPDHFVGGVSFDFAALGLGLDYNFASFIGLGTFVELSAGTYLTGFEIHGDDSNSAAVEDSALHYDLDVGLRVLFRI